MFGALSVEVPSFGSYYTGLKGGLLFLRELALTSWCSGCSPSRRPHATGVKFFFFFSFRSQSCSWEAFLKRLVRRFFKAVSSQKFVLKGGLLSLLDLDQ